MSRENGLSDKFEAWLNDPATIRREQEFLRNQRIKEVVGTGLTVLVQFIIAAVATCLFIGGLFGLTAWLVS